VVRRLNFTATAEEIADKEMWQSKDELVSEWCQVGMPPAERNKGPTLVVETQKLDGEFWGADCLGSTIDQDVQNWLCTPPCSPFAGICASDSEAQHGDKQSAHKPADDQKFGCGLGARSAFSTAGGEVKFCAKQSSSAPCFPCARTQCPLI